MVWLLENNGLLLESNNLSSGEQSPGFLRTAVWLLENNGLVSGEQRSGFYRTMAWVLENNGLASGKQWSGFWRTMAWLLENSGLGSGEQRSGFWRTMAWVLENIGLASGKQWSGFRRNIHLPDLLKTNHVLEKHWTRNQVSGRIRIRLQIRSPFCKELCCVSITHNVCKVLNLFCCHRLFRC